LSLQLLLEFQKLHCLVELRLVDPRKFAAFTFRCRLPEF
jgi:hypothetical protein